MGKSVVEVIENVLFRKIELWLVLLLLMVVASAGVLSGHILKAHLADGRNYPVAGAIVLKVASLPSDVKSLLSSRGAYGVVSTEKRFVGQSGAVFEDEIAVDAIVIIPRLCDYDTWCVDFIDLKNRTSKILDVSQQIRAYTEKLRPDKLGFAIGSAAVPRSPRLDNFGNVTLVTNSGLLMQFSLNGDVRWANSNFHFHHTFNFDDDHQYIWAIGTEIDGNVFIDESFNYQTLTNDVIVKVDAKTGKVDEVFSVVDALVDANLHNYAFVGRGDFSSADPLHMNDIEPVLADTKFFEKGDLFISLGHSNLVFLFSTATKKIKWHTTDGMFHQHDIDIISDTQIGIFNNNRIYTDSDKVFKHNEVLIYNFETKTFDSPFDKLLEDADVRTISQGLFDYKNDLLFIEETNYGRLLLFSGSKQVFAYYSKSDDDYPQSLGWSDIIYSEAVLGLVRANM